MSDDMRQTRLLLLLLETLLHNALEHSDRDIAGQEDTEVSELGRRVALDETVEDRARAGCVRVLWMKQNINTCKGAQNRHWGGQC